jgi:colanic acid/amylovoran biosynthesis glycosyltransferase
MTTIAYVTKMYPRFSETFIVNEILAHQDAGQPLEIVSLRLPTDGRFHDVLAKVQAPVTYIPDDSSKLSIFWAELRKGRREFPRLWPLLADEPETDPADIFQAIHLARLVRKKKISLLHAHFASVSTTVARLAALLTGIPYTFTAHAKDIYHESVEPADLRRKLRDAAGVITVTDYNLSFLRQTYGEDAQRVQRLYNGLDLNRFAFQPNQERAPHILGVGRLVPKKGFDLLIDACVELKRRGVHFTCSLIGSGEEEANLRRHIAQTGMGGQVHMLGALPQTDVIRYMQQASVFAAPCIVAEDGNRDGMPTVLLEAMALGTPCVSTDVTGIGEAIRHDETGLMTVPGDVIGLADALQRLLADTTLRRRLANAARAQVERDFDIRRNAAEQRALFHRATQRHANFQMQEAA